MCWSRLILLFVFLLAQSVLPGQAEAGKKVVLCSTFPLYQITRNVAAGSQSLDIRLMLSSALGCPHDYALTPQDMQKLSVADLLILNGQGLEEFLGDALKNPRPRLTILDSSAGISDLLNYNEDDTGHHHEDQANTGVNPHLFVSPRMTAEITKNIARALAKLDTEGAAGYERNALAYAKKMETLAKDFAALGKRLANHRIVTQHGVFDYLARDMGLEIVAVVQAHPGQDPSAAEMLTIIKTAKGKKAGAVFTEPQYPGKTGQTIATEAGIKSATLDPAASGPEDAALDYYETVMRRNMSTLEQVLGVK